MKGAAKLLLWGIVIMLGIEIGAPVFMKPAYWFRFGHPDGCAF